NAINGLVGKLSISQSMLLQTLNVLVDKVAANENDANAQNMVAQLNALKQKIYQEYDVVLQIPSMTSSATPLSTLTSPSSPFETIVAAKKQLAKVSWFFSREDEVVTPPVTPVKEKSV